MIDARVGRPTSRYGQRIAGILFLILATALSWGATESRASEGAAPRYYIPTLPQDGASLEMYLITGGLGDDVANRYGHTAIRVIDREAGTDAVFNWGTYSFENFGFLWDFFRGSLIYRMGVRSFDIDVEHYEEEGRRLSQERINLTPQQRLKLLDKIRWNAHPENRKFAYQYWFKNCATIPRDYLDEVLGGLVSRNFVEKPTGKVHRDYVRSHLSGVPFVAPVLDTFMNSNIDRPISAWDEMFLPAGLRDHLRSLPAIDDQGQPIPGLSLLSETEVLLDNPEYFGRPFNDYLVLASFYGAPLLLAWILFLAARLEPIWRPRAYRVLGVASIAWGLVGGVAGVVLLLNWLFSGHPDGWHNVNLAFFMPFDLWYVAHGRALWRARGPVKDRWPWPRTGAILSLLHVLAALMVVGLAAAHIVTQDIWRVTGWLVLPALALQLTIPVVSFLRAPLTVAKTSQSGSVDSAPSESAGMTRRRSSRTIKV